MCASVCERVWSESERESVCVCVWRQRRTLVIPPSQTHTMHVSLREGERGRVKKGKKYSFGGIEGRNRFSRLQIASGYSLLERSKNILFGRKNWKKVVFWEREVFMQNVILLLFPLSLSFDERQQRNCVTSFWQKKNQIVFFYEKC